MRILFFLLLIQASCSLIASSSSACWVPFNEGMSVNTFYDHDHDSAHQSATWQRIQSNYRSFLKHVSSIQRLKIPKIIHLIWLGSPLPERCKRLLKTWQNHHPTWEIKLWTEKEIDDFGLINKHTYDESSNYGVKSDIARYEILYRIGGLYVDTDFECLKTFDELHYACSFYTGLGYRATPFCYNGLIGSVPYHPILEECINGIAEHEGQEKETDVEIFKRTGPEYFTKCIKRVFKKCPHDTVLFPTNYFYPWPYYERHDKDPEHIASWIRPESRALHHWAVSWMKHP